MDRIEGAVFDLDDTLYPECDYVLSGFAQVARRVALDEEMEGAVRSFLVDSFNDGVRGDSFNRMLKAFPDVSKRWTVVELVSVYRAHKPDIEMASLTRDLLDGLIAAGIRLALITDGPVESQSAKIEALGIEPYFRPCIITDRWGIEFRKPHPRAFLKVMEEWRTPAERLVYIADNPLKDFKAPCRLGWKTIRLTCHNAVRGNAPSPAEEDDSTLVVESIPELSKFLRQHVSYFGAVSGVRL